MYRMYGTSQLWGDIGEAGLLNILQMQIIAHRGASGSYPENTLLAIEQALLAKADGIEIDVFCVENQLVVIHDENVSRTTNGTGLLQDFTLQAITATGCWFRPAGPHFMASAATGKQPKPAEYRTRKVLTQQNLY